MLGYLSFDIICSSKLTVFLELRSWKTIRFSEQILSADKHLSIFSRQLETIVYLDLSHIPTNNDNEYIEIKVDKNTANAWKLNVNPNLAVMLFFVLTEVECTKGPLAF